jgi:RNA polymerase primary sigma factor
MFGETYTDIDVLDPQEIADSHLFDGDYYESIRSEVLEEVEASDIDQLDAEELDVAANGVRKVTNSQSEVLEEVEAKTFPSTIDQLMKEARKHPRLSREDEAKLARQIEKGDLEAKDEMIKSNLGLVVKIALKSRGRGLEEDDLVQEGMLGLIRAVEKFDYRKGFKFSTYGTLWIKQSVTRAIDDKGSTIRKPNRVAELSRKIDKARSEMMRKLNHNPGPEEMALFLGIDKQDVEDALSSGHNTVPLEMSIDGRIGTRTYGDTIPDENKTEEALENLHQKDIKARLAEAFEGLSPQDIKIAYLYYAYDENVLKIARQFTLTQKEVRAILADAERRVGSSGFLRSAA